MDIEPVVVTDQRNPSRTLLAGAIVSFVLGGGGLWTVITNPLLSSSKTAQLYHLPVAARVVMGVISVPLLVFALLAFVMAATLKRNKLTFSVSGVGVTGDVRGFRMTWHEIGQIFLVDQSNQDTSFRLQFSLVDSEQDLSFLANQEADGRRWYEIPLDLTSKKAGTVENAISRFRPRLVEGSIRTHVSRVNPRILPGEN